MGCIITDEFINKYKSNYIINKIIYIAPAVPKW